MCLCGNEPRCTATIFSDSPRGFQMAAFGSKSSSLCRFLILILNGLMVWAAGTYPSGRKGQMSRLHRSLAADLFISLHQICHWHTCVFVGLYKSVFKHGLIFRNSPGHGGDFTNKSAVQPPVSFLRFKVLYSLCILKGTVHPKIKNTHFSSYL